MGNDLINKDDKEIILSNDNPIDCLLRYCENIRLGFHPKDEKREKKIFDTNGEFFCRGEPKIFKTKLRPKIFRDENLKYDEADLIIDFQTTFPKYRKEFSDDLDWLSLMQHYGLPTRLLDWSINPLVALYFSLGLDEYSDNDGAFYVVPICNRLETRFTKNPSIKHATKWSMEYYLALAQCGLYEQVGNLIIKYVFSMYDESLVKIVPNADGSFANEIYYVDRLEGKKITENFYNDMSLRDVVEVFPAQSHERIISQSGRFTLHYGKYINTNQVLTNEISMKDSEFFKKLFCIIIPSNIKSKLLKSLRIMNIHKFSLFPEEENFFSYYINKTSKDELLSDLKEEKKLQTV